MESDLSHMAAGDLHPRLTPHGSASDSGSSAQKPASSRIATLTLLASYTITHCLKTPQYSVQIKG